MGRVIDPLGNPLDGKGPIKAETMRPVEMIAPEGTIKIDGYAMTYDGYRLEAIDDYVTAIQTAPRTAELWNNLGISYAAVGRIGEVEPSAIPARRK